MPSVSQMNYSSAQEFLWLTGSKKFDLRSYTVASIFLDHRLGLIGARFKLTFNQFEVLELGS